MGISGGEKNDGYSSVLSVTDGQTDRIAVAHSTPAYNESSGKKRSL